MRTAAPEAPPSPLEARLETRLQSIRREGANPDLPNLHGTQPAPTDRLRARILSPRRLPFRGQEIEDPIADQLAVLLSHPGHRSRLSIPLLQ